MRSRFIAAGVAVSAALALVPAAGAQDVVDDVDTVVSDPTDEPSDPSEPDDPTDESSEPTEPAEPSGPSDEPTEPAEPVAPRIAVEVRVEANGAMQVVDIASIAGVSDRLPVGTPVQWKFDGNRPDEGRALTADGRLYVAPPTEGTAQIPVLAVDTATGQVVLGVDVTVNANAPDKSNNPDATRQPATAKDIAIIVGSVLGVLGLLAAMVQFLVPGGWGQVIQFYA